MDDQKYTLPKKTLEKRQKQLQETLRDVEERAEKTEQKLAKREAEFLQARKSTLLSLLNPEKVKQSVRTIGAYILGRRNRKRLYSKTYKRKQAANDLKGYVTALYEDGFVERAVANLKEICKETKNRYLKRASAWELALWYANKQIKEAKENALTYIALAKEKEADHDKLRRIAIVEAECLLALGHVRRAEQRLHEQLQKEKHPDLYLALANTTTNIEQKTFWINEALSHYGRKPIHFRSTNDAATVTYDDLATEKATSIYDGPKVSVILPAYNSEKGIDTAIESILQQTWRNLELLIVDDCSTDRTMEVIKRYANLDDRIQIFQTPTNSGPYVARNIALKHATGEFVTVNDADDWSHAEKIAIQAKHLSENPLVIANTSEQARFTDDLQFYRRGTRGKYIFSNMSSIMFRRKEVMEKLGYWDEVRFAADGEFKRRLITAFGKELVIDLQTGPLSFPRQSNTSLTGHGAFGYNGYFFGVRREYFESFTTFHDRTENLYYDMNVSVKKRPFPVPRPMLPSYDADDVNEVDIVIVANFYELTETEVERILKKLKVHDQLGLTTGLMQLKPYDLKRKRKIHPRIRETIDGTNVRRIVYGEHIKTNIVIVTNHHLLEEIQQFVPHISTKSTLIVIDEKEKIPYNKTTGLKRTLRELVHHSLHYFDRRGRWYPLNETIRKRLNTTRKNELSYITLAKENWVQDDESFIDTYGERIRPWLFPESR